MSEMCCTRLAENTGCKNHAKKSPSAHHRTTLSGYIFATKARIDSLKKLVKQQCLPTCPQNMVNLCPLAAGWDLLASLGHPANFNEFRVLVALLHGTLVVDVGQTLRRWTEGATHIRQGSHHVRHWPTFLVSDLFSVEVFGACLLSCTHQ